MDTTNTVESNTKNTQPKKYEFAEAFGNILFFPFRLAFYVYKYTIRVVSIILFVGLIAIAIRSAYPMNLPEARGMTYYQFLGHRWTSYEYAKKDSPMIFVAAMYVMYPPYYLLAAQIPFFELFPDSKFTHWYRTEIIDDANYAHFKPRTKVTWTNLPASLWDVFERTNWFYFVTISESSDPPMTYPNN